MELGHTYDILKFFQKQFPKHIFLRREKLVLSFGEPIFFLLSSESIKLKLLAVPAPNANWTATLVVFLLHAKVHEYALHDWQYCKAKMPTKSEMNAKYGHYICFGEIQVETQVIKNN